MTDPNNIGPGVTIHDAAGCTTYYDGCNCAEVIKNLEGEVRRLRLVDEFGTSINRALGAEVARLKADNEALRAQEAQP